jgi:hypothetical protein
MIQEIKNVFSEVEQANEKGIAKKEIRTRMEKAFIEIRKEFEMACLECDFND